MSIEKGGVRFQGYNQPKSTPSHPKKKMAVLAKVGDKTKLIRFGAKGYSDFTKHKDPARRKRYLARHSAIKLKDGSKAINNKLQAAYWAKKVLW
jgi:hypothetical protein